MSAVEQLQGMAVKRQYKEAAGQLEVGIKILKCSHIGCSVLVTTQFLLLNSKCEGQMLVHRRKE